MSKLSKIAAAFPRTLGHRDVTDPWGMGFTVRVRRADNADWRAWARKMLDPAELREAVVKAQMRASAEPRDWRRPQTAAETQQALIDHFRLERGGEGMRSVEDQAPGIREHLIARDASGPLAWIDGERLTDRELEDLTTVRYGDEGEPLRWMPEKDGDTPNLFGGQPFEIAFLQWISREADDLAAFEERRTEGDLGNSGGGPGGGTASTNRPPSESSTDAESSSTAESGGAVSGAA